mmetsp:Transcript_99178/g.286186  ORF Transcript_99178/g.286186 Transcript_99178/m.286186 type:complete len:259 (+) Transcript_99178:90-866(+)
MFSHRSEQNNLHTQMMMVHDDIEGFTREGTAELKNDPRFFTENIIDKRLAAFEALAIVTELVSEQACEQCFELTKDFTFTGGMLHVAIMQLIGFFIMVFVLFLTTVATAVLSLQLFFTIRLLTVGPTGFDKAKRFYQDNRMWVWRERAIFGVKWSLAFFLMSTGFMLYVKFYTEGAPKVEEMSKEAKEMEYWQHKQVAAVVLAVFIMCTLALARLVTIHQRVFDESYVSLDACTNEMNRHLLTNRSMMMPASDRSSLG